MWPVLSGQKHAQPFSDHLSRVVMLVVSGGKATEPPGVSVIALVKLVRVVAAGLSQQRAMVDHVMMAIMSVGSAIGSAERRC